jgi:hypothetical protein
VFTQLFRCSKCGGCCEAIYRIRLQHVCGVCALVWYGVRIDECKLI